MLRCSIQVSMFAAMALLFAAYGAGSAFAEDASSNQSEDAAYIKNVNNSSVPNDTGDNARRRRATPGIRPPVDGVIVPEPATIALLGLGLAGLGLARRRKKD